MLQAERGAHGAALVSFPRPRLPSAWPGASARRGGRAGGTARAGSGRYQGPGPDFETILSALDRLKLLPLPQGVLLPGSALPLTLYEPRYLALAAEALRGDRLLAVAMLAPGRAADHEGRPAVRPVACLGLVEHADRLPDGRLEILVRGVSRIRLHGEHPASGPFREVFAQFLDEAPLAGRQQLETVRSALGPLCEALPKVRRQALWAATAHLDDPGNLCDVVAAAVLDEPDDLQGILEALAVGERVERLLGGISALLLSAQPRPPARMLS